jgi:hypothetical protein
MIGSFVVKFKNMGEKLDIQLPAVYFKEFFLNEVKNLNDTFKINILKKRPNNCIIGEGENFYLRFSYFEDESFSRISQELFKYRLLKLPIKQFEVSGFVSKGDRNFWNKSYEDIEIEDSFILDFYTPLLIKFGNNFIMEFEIYLILNQLYKENSRFEKVEIKKISSKIKSNVLESKPQRVLLERNFGYGSKTKVMIDIGGLSYYEKEFVKELLAMGHFTGVGYKKDYGYGMYCIRKKEDL